MAILASKNFNLRPTPLKSFKCSIVGEVQDFTPLFKGFFDIVKNNVNGFSLVSVLHFLSSPLTIFRRVISVIVNSINRMLRSRAFTHVSVKTFKRSEPAIANPNTPKTISRILFMFQACCSFYHISPISIFGRIRHSVSRFSQLCCALFSQTATALVGAILKLIAESKARITTIANANPFNSIFDCAIGVEHKKTIKFLTT